MDSPATLVARLHEPGLSDEEHAASWTAYTRALAADREGVVAAQDRYLDACAGWSQ